MSRNLDSTLLAALTAGVVHPALLVQLTFRTGTHYIWTGIGPLVSNGQTFTGVGSLGNMGAISEGTSVQADGTTLSLSGIDPVLYAECMTDIQLGAPAKIWLTVLNQGVMVGAPYLLFSGLVDKPSVTTGSTSITVSLALENRLINLQRPSARRYTAADQHIKYPDDTAFNWVEMLNDIALVWGT
jgi:hypothetical protein